VIFLIYTYCITLIYNNNPIGINLFLTRQVNIDYDDKVYLHYNNNKTQSTMTSAHLWAWLRVLLLVWHVWQYIYIIM